MKKKISSKTLLEDGSVASTGHKPSTCRKPSTKKIIETDSVVLKQIETDKKVEAYAYKIRQEVKKLNLLAEEISSAYSAYAESNEKIDSCPSLHNGLGNMMKLIEVQTTTKLRIKKMQTAIMQIIAAETADDELPYALQDIMREVNVNFLDSKLVRAYGEIAKIMKEDLELAKVQGKELQFVQSELTSELEAMPTIEAGLDLNRDDAEEVYEEDE